MNIKNLYDNYTMLFVATTSDNKVNRRVVLLRILSVIGILIFWISLNDYIQYPPTIEDADVSIGVIVKVTGGKGRSAGKRNVFIETNSTTRKFRTVSYDVASQLKSNIGNTAKIWSYPSRDMFFIERYKIITAEVDGLVIGNNWPETKEKIESRKSITSVFMGFTLMVFPLPIISWIFKKIS